MSNRPEFIDNQQGNTLAEAIRQYLDHLQGKLSEPPRLDIATGYFNPEGFFALSDQLEELDHVRILLGAEPKDKDRSRWRKPGEPKGREYKSEMIDEVLQSLNEDLKRDRDLLGFSGEINQSLQDMIDVLESDLVEVRKYNEGFLHGKAFIFSDEEGVIGGSSNFTSAGLNSNLELNLGHYDPHVTEKVENWFDELWNDSEEFDLASVYNERFKPFPPYLIYLKALWERYKEELEEEKEESSSGEIELTTFQKHGLSRAKRFMDRHNGVIVADEVGLGKTYIAGELMREAVEEKRQRALVIAPAYLRDGMWTQFRSDKNFHFEILSYAQLRNARQLGGDKEWLKQDKDEYQLVVIDEGHSFRNPSTDQTQALRRLLQGSPPKDLMLLTATPVNNSLWDLYYLINLFIKNDAAFASEGIPSLRDRFKEAQSSDPSELSPDMLFDVLDSTSVRRTRQFVEEFYENETLPDGEGGSIRIKFPDVKPRRVDYTFHKTISDDFFEDVADGLAAGEYEDPKLTMARYRPSVYKSGSGDGDGSELALVGLIRTGILKRFESSRKAFANTLDNMIEQYEASLNILDQGYFPESEAIEEWVESDSDRFEDEVFSETKNGTENWTEVSEFDEEKLRDDLKNDLVILRKWNDKALSIEQSQDAKLASLVETLENIIDEADEEAANEEEFEKNKKVLIFSYFEDTVDWILDYLQEAVKQSDKLSGYEGRIAGVAGNKPKQGVSREDAVHGFAPNSPDSPPSAENNYDILITTDVLAQGVNLQECRNVINYDLPWNPMRVVQRNGRINRLDSTHSTIYPYTFFPEERLDDLLELESRIRDKLAQAAHSIGIETEVIPDSETSRQNFADRREDIEELKEENPQVFTDTERESSALSGEQYRQQLRQGLKDNEDRIKTLPWGAGSGFVGDDPGYFFCSRVGEQLFMRFLPLKGEEIVEDTLTCLKKIECSEQTERELPEEMKQGVYQAWEEAREDIYKTWQKQTDPANVQPEIGKIYRQVGEHLRRYPPEDINQDELDRYMDSVEAPQGARNKRELRQIYRKDIPAVEKSKELIEKIDELGLEPFEAPEPLPPIDKEQVKLICWLAVAPEEDTVDYHYQPTLIDL